MGKDDGESKPSVPYDRMIDTESTAGVLEGDQQSRDGSATIPQRLDEISKNLSTYGYQNSVSVGAGMGGAEHEATTAEQEELFAQYREDENKALTGPSISGNNSEEDPEDRQMTGNRSKRNEPNRQANNRLRDMEATFSRKLLLANAFANALMFIVAGYITYHCFNKAMVLFSWHPTFMSIGYLILMSQAVLTMSGANFFTHRLDRRSKVFLHWVLQAIAGVLITIASVCIFLHKIRLGKPHFQTVHGIFGLTTVCFTLLSIAGGMTAKFAFQFRQIMRPIYSKLIHGVVGTLAYLLAMVTIGLGVYSRWFQEDNDANVRLSLVIAIGIVALFVIVSPITNTIQRIRTSVRSTL